jgi:hypothetical protein
MLLPALENAIGAAHTISCANNLKQTGTGSLMYANDNNDWANFPYHNNSLLASNGGDGKSFWIYGHAISEYVGIDAHPMPSNPALFLCPSDEVPGYYHYGPGTDQVANGIPYGQFFHSYGMSYRRFCPQDSSVTLRPLSAFKAPSATVFYTEVIDDGVSGTNGSISYEGRIHMAMVQHRI